MPDDKEFRYACIIQAGELEPNGHRFIRNDLYHFEVVKNNVTRAEVDEWLGSLERINRVLELERIGQEKFGKDYWMKYNVSSYCTSAMKDNEMQKQ